MQSLTSIKLDYDGDQTFETTLATTDYWTEPRNETPKTSIRMKPQGAEHFTLREYSVEVTATWGYNATASIPPVVSQATLLQANRLWNRRGSPFGVAGTNEMGQALVIAKLDPDIELLLNPLRRLA